MKMYRNKYKNKYMKIWWLLSKVDGLYQFPDLDVFSIVMQDVTTREIWVKGNQDSSA